MSDGKPRRTNRILLVDDEEALVWSLASRLARVRPDDVVVTAHDAESALVLAREAPVDLLIADIRMPGMSGIDLVLAVRSARPHVPVVVMTAFKSADIERITPGPFTAFLEKPFVFVDLVALVEEALTPKPQVGFSGAISVQTLPDIVQLYVMSSATGVLTIKHRGGDGEVWFENGSIPHAKTGALVGDDAFYEIMTWSGGDFAMRPGAAPPAVTVKSHWQELLMEGCRRNDERARDEGARHSSTGWTQVPPPPGSGDVDFNEVFGADPAALSAPPAPQLPTQSETASQENPPMNIKDSLNKLNQIDGFVGAALVDSDSGMLLGQEGGGPVNLELAAAGNTEVVRSKRKTMNSLNLKDAIEDMLITLGKQYHLIRPMRARPAIFFYVVLDRQRANLAMARIALADVERDLQV